MPKCRNFVFAFGLLSLDGLCSESCTDHTVCAGRSLGSPLCVWSIVTWLPPPTSFLHCSPNRVPQFSWNLLLPLWRTFFFTLDVYLAFFSLTSVGHLLVHSSFLRLPWAHYSNSPLHPHRAFWLYCSVCLPWHAPPTAISHINLLFFLSFFSYWPSPSTGMFPPWGYGVLSPLFISIKLVPVQERCHPLPVGWLETSWSSTGLLMALQSCTCPHRGHF